MKSYVKGGKGQYHWTEHIRLRLVDVAIAFEQEMIQGFVRLRDKWKFVTDRMQNAFKTLEKRCSDHNLELRQYKCRSQLSTMIEKFRIMEDHDIKPPYGRITTRLHAKLRRLNQLLRYKKLGRQLRRPSLPEEIKKKLPTIPSQPPHNSKSNRRSSRDKHHNPEPVTTDSEDDFSPSRESDEDYNVMHHSFSADGCDDDHSFAKPARGYDSCHDDAGYDGDEASLSGEGHAAIVEVGGPSRKKTADSTEDVRAPLRIRHRKSDDSKLSPSRGGNTRPKSIPSRSPVSDDSKFSPGRRRKHAHKSDPRSSPDGALKFQHHDRWRTRISKPFTRSQALTGRGSKTETRHHSGANVHPSNCFRSGDELLDVVECQFLESLDKELGHLSLWFDEQAVPKGRQVVYDAIAARIATSSSYRSSRLPLDMDMRDDFEKKVEDGFQNLRFKLSVDFQETIKNLAQKLKEDLSNYV